jgi:hypothetical protein
VIVSDDLESFIIYKTDTRVACAEINTDDGPGDSIPVIHERLLVLGASCLHQNQSNKETQKVVEHVPCKALALIP